MISYGKHSRTQKVPGAESFHQWLDGVAGVDKVMVGNIRTRKVSAGKKEEPRFRSLRRCVEVTYYAGGALQMIRVFPQRVVTAHELFQRITTAWAQNQRRGGVGMSPKDPIHIPEGIRRRQQEGTMHTGTANTDTDSRPSAAIAVAEPPPVAPAPTPAPPTNPAPPPVYKLSERQARVYEFILGHETTGQLQFEIDRLFGRVQSAFGKDAATHPIQALKKFGLIEPLDKVTSGFGAIVRFRILRRPYEVVMKTPAVKKPSRPATADTPSDDSIEQHLKFFAKHRAVLNEAERRRKALSKKGFELIEVRGQLAVIPKR